MKDFQNLTEDSRILTFSLPKISSTSLEEIFHLAYSGIFSRNNLSMEEVTEILACANMWKFEDGIHSCITCIHHISGPSNIYPLLVACVHLDLPQTVLQYALSFFMHLLDRRLVGDLRESLAELGCDTATIQHLESQFALPKEPLVNFNTKYTTTLTTDISSLINLEGVVADGDITLIFGEGKLQAHKWLLSARSEFFKVILSTSVGVHCSDSLTLEATGVFTFDALKTLLIYLYHDNTTHIVDPNISIQITGNASYFCLSEDSEKTRDHSKLLQACEKCLKDSLDVETCLETLATVVECNLRVTEGPVLDWIVTHLGEISDEKLEALDAKLWRKIQIKLSKMMMITSKQII